jgi:hypothetical protein
MEFIGIDKHTKNKDIRSNDEIMKLLSYKHPVIYCISGVKVAADDSEYITLYIIQQLPRNGFSLANKKGIDEADKFFNSWSNMQLLRTIKNVTIEAIESNEELFEMCKEGKVMEGWNIQSNDVLEEPWDGENSAKIQTINGIKHYKCFDGKKIYTLKNLVLGETENTVIKHNGLYTEEQLKIVKENLLPFNKIQAFKPLEEIQR